MRSFMLVTLLLASCASSVYAVCSGAGYDVSSVEQDLFFNSTFYEWWLRPCGSISASSDPVCGSSALFPYGSMLCQRPHGSSGAYNLAIYNSSTQVQWLETAAHNGVEYRVQDGDMCGSFRRESTIRFTCDQTATTPQIVSITEGETCWYTVVVKTSSVCTSVGPTAGNSVGSSFWSAQCGGGIFDLSSISSSDMVWQDVGYIWYVRMCGTVSNTACSTAQPTSLCQQLKSNIAQVYDASHYNLSESSLWTITPTGVRVSLQDGAVCSAIGAGVPRQTTFELICNPYITVSFVSYITEVETCHYTVVIQTPAVCTGSNAPQNGYCGGAGGDFSLINTEFYMRSGDYDWYIRPCGTLSSFATTACGSRASGCQVRTDTPAAGNLISIWNATVSHESTIWTFIPGQGTTPSAFTYSVQDGGLCGAIGNVPREMTVRFECDTSALTPVFASIQEVETCWYTATIRTYLACFRQAPIDSNAIGYTYVDSVCGGERYDFSNIRATGDLILDTNTSSTTSGWMYAIDLCGRVVNSRCASVQPTSFCQYGKPTGSAVYSLGYMGANIQATYTVNANGITMTYADGQGCGGIPSRVAIIQIICDGTAPARLESVREIETCHYQAVVRAQCNPGSTVPLPESSSSSTGSGQAVIPITAPTVSSCAGAGYDMTAVAQQSYLWTDTAYQWYLRPCAILSYQQSSVCGNAANFPWGSSLCQQPIGQTLAYNVAVFNASTSAIWLAIPGGVQYSIQDGDFCGSAGFRREVTVKFMCDATATTPVLASVQEVELCWYTATIRTSSACSPTGPTGGNSVGSSFLSYQCGAGIYDLSSLSNSDLLWSDASYDWSVRVCGTVSNANCSSIQPTSLCQFDRGTSAYDGSHWNVSDPAVWTITPDGLSARISDGGICTAVGAAARRTSIFDFRCNPYVTVSYISYIREIETCHYTVVIQTPLVCSSSNRPINGICSGAGYDMTLVDTDLTVVTGGWTWYVAVCKPLSPFTTTACPGASVCQVSGTSAYPISYWNASVSQQASWLAINGGVQMTVQDGSPCAAVNADYRELTVKFMCDANAGTPVLDSVTEPETCWYTATIRTAAACYQQAPVDRNAVGYTYTDFGCGGSRFANEFANIATQGDLVFDSNSSSSTEGYIYYLHVCSNVAAPQCASVQPTTFCQTEKPATPGGTAGAYSLALFNASTPVTYTINSNGMTMVVRDGTPCGSIPNRVASIQIVCDGTSPARVDSLREVEVCHYSAVVRAPCSAATNPGVGSSSTGSNGGTTGTTGTGQSGGSTGQSGGSTGQGGGAVDNSSSSSLTGGAIAGAVIGSVVGALIICAVVVCLCCGQYRGNKKSATSGESGVGRFDSIEESRTEDAHEIEMGETGHTNE